MNRVPAGAQKDRYVVIAALACVLCAALLFRGGASAGLPADAPDAEAFRMLSSMEQYETIERLSKAAPEDAWQYLISVATKDGTVVLDAHGLGHIIGNELYRQHGIESVTGCSNEFAYACMHGVTEELLAQNGSFALPAVEASCRDFFMSKGEPVYQGMSGCIHGSGHGLLTYVAYDVPSALRECDAFSEEVRNYCYDGVFMEAAQDAPSLEAAAQDDPWSLCAGLSGEMLTQCSRYLPVTVMTWKARTREWDMSRSHAKELFALCEASPHQESASRCVESIGHIIAQNLHQQPADIIGECSAAPEEKMRAACLAAAATEVSFQRYENRKEAVALLCAAIRDARASQECAESAELTHARETQ